MAITTVKNRFTGHVAEDKKQERLRGCMDAVQKLSPAHLQIVQTKIAALTLQALTTLSERIPSDLWVQILIASRIIYLDYRYVCKAWAEEQFTQQIFDTIPADFDPDGFRETQYSNTLTKVKVFNQRLRKDAQASGLDHWHHNDYMVLDSKELARYQKKTMQHKDKALCTLWPFMRKSLKSHFRSHSLPISLPDKTASPATIRSALKPIRVSEDTKFSCNNIHLRGLSAELNTCGWKNLQISMSNLEHLPDWVFSCKKIILENSNFETFPSRCSNTIQTLNLINNPLYDIDVSGYPNLKVLDLQGTDLHEAPDVTQNRYLKSLFIDGFDTPTNGIAVSPDLSQSIHLTRLGLGNRLSQFPDITPCQNLAVLFLDNNQITDIPHWDQQFPKLIRLNLANNLIVEISNLLTMFPNLETLNIEKNPLLYIAPEICTKFREDPAVLHYQSQLSSKYTCQSDFGRFVQRLMENNKTGCQRSHALLKEQDQQLISEAFQAVCEKKGISPIPALFQDLSLLRHAIRKIQFGDTAKGTAHFPMCADLRDAQQG